MTLTSADYEVMYAFVFAFVLYWNTFAWTMHPREGPREGQESGYATILQFLRGGPLVALSGFFWFFFALYTVAFDSAIGSTFMGPAIWIFYGLGLMNIVMGIVITVYLVLPTERLPKAFQFLDHARQKEDVPRE